MQTPARQWTNIVMSCSTWEAKFNAFSRSIICSRTFFPINGHHGHCVSPSCTRYLYSRLVYSPPLIWTLMQTQPHLVAISASRLPHQLNSRLIEAAGGFQAQETLHLRKSLGPALLRRCSWIAAQRSRRHVAVRQQVFLKRAKKRCWAPQCCLPPYQIH